MEEAGIDNRFTYDADPAVRCLFVQAQGLIESSIWHSHFLKMASGHPIEKGQSALFDFRDAHFADDWDELLLRDRRSGIGPEFILALRPKKIAYVTDTSAAQKTVNQLIQAIDNSVGSFTQEQKIYTTIEGARLWLDIPDAYVIAMPDGDSLDAETDA